MKLTGKTLEDFGDKCTLDFYEFKILPKCAQNAIIINWLDSVGIYISTPPFFDKYAKYNKGFECLVYQDNSDVIKESFSDNDVFYTRSEAIEQAIITANNIYNERAKQESQHN